jgi:hypothetical protein
MNWALLCEDLCAANTVVHVVDLIRQMIGEATAWMPTWDVHPLPTTLACTSASIITLLPLRLPQKYGDSQFSASCLFEFCRAPQRRLPRQWQQVWMSLTAPNPSAPPRVAVPFTSPGTRSMRLHWQLHSRSTSSSSRRKRSRQQQRQAVAVEGLQLTEKHPLL